MMIIYTVNADLAELCRACRRAALQVQEQISLFGKRITQKQERSRRQQCEQRLADLETMLQHTNASIEELTKRETSTQEQLAELSQCVLHMNVIGELQHTSLKLT